MSGYASKAEVMAVVKDAITSDCNRTGLSTNPADYNLAAIVRENFQSRGAGYGWGVSTGSADEFVASLRRNLRTRATIVEEAPAEVATPDVVGPAPADPVESAPTVGDLVRIYNRSRWYDADGVEQRARTLQPGTWRILRANRHGDWTVSNAPGTSHDVFRDDVEHIPAETEAPAGASETDQDAPAVDQVRAQLRAAQRDGRLPESATFHVAADSDGTVNVDVRGMPDTWTYAQTGYGHGQYTGAALQTIETVCRILDGIGAVDAHSVVIESEEEASERDGAEQGTPDELAPGMYRVRITVTNRDGVHTATEDMNPAAIELARTRPGWTVEILGETRVTIVEDEQDAPATSDVALTWPATDVERDELRGRYLAAATSEERRTAARALGGETPLGCSECGSRQFVDSSAEEEAWWAVHGGADEPCTTATPDETEPLAVGETFTRMVRGVAARAKPRPVIYTVTGYGEGRGGPIVLVRSDYQGDGSMPVSMLREYLAGEADRRAAVIRPIPVEMQRQLTGERRQVDRGTCDTCKTGCGHRFDEVPGCTHYGCLGADGATADTCPGAQAAITGARVETDPRTVTGTPENIDARASARARGELAAQASLTFDEGDRQAMTVAQLAAVPAGALALF